MQHSEPGLFELPDPVPSHRSQRGRNRQTWAMTVTADVTVTDAAAVDEAIAQAQADGLMIGYHDDDLPDEDPPGTESGEINQLGWLIWPEGQDALQEAGAFRIVRLDVAVADEAADRCRITWTITVKLTEVERLRQLAIAAHPDDAGLIADNLDVAWQRAADPYAPLGPIPGIAWEPVDVTVAHLPARNR